MHKFKVSIGPVCLALALIATGVQADTYTVTQGGCAGSGSLREAIEMANANPGKDTVNFDASVTRVQPTSGSTACASPRSIQITESVDVIGPGIGKLSISDDVGWVTPSGHLNAGLACDSGNVVIANGDIPFVVTGDGTPEVTIKDVTFTKNFGVLEVRSKPAVINFEDVLIRENYGAGKDCEGAPVFVVGQLNMTNVLVLSNKMTNAAPRDAIVWVNGGARLQETRFLSNRAASQFFQIGDASDKIIIRESVSNSPQPRIVIAGGTADIVNTLITGESGGAGVHALNAKVTLINSTISLPQRVSQIQAPSGELAAAMHVLAEESGLVQLYNTIVDGAGGASQAVLPMVAATGSAVIEASLDSHITDGSGPIGPSSGSPNLNGAFMPLGPPSKDGGRNEWALDPETLPDLQPLATDLDGKPRIQGPSVDKGAYEIQENHAYDDDYEVLVDTPFDSTTSITSSQASVLDNDAWVDKGTPQSPDVQARLINPPSRGTLDLKPDGTFTYDPPPGYYGVVTFQYTMISAQPLIIDQGVVTLNIREEPFTLIGTHPDQYTINEGQQLVTNATNAPIVNDQIDEFLYWARLGSIVRVVDPPDHAASFDFPVDSEFSYTPEDGFVGTDSFTYEIYLEKTKKIVSVETTVTIEVLDVNAPPVAQDDAYSTQQGVSKQFTPSLLKNDSDPDGNPLTVVKKSDPAHATLTLLDGGFFALTDLDPDFSGTDSFTYAASDGTDESNIATVTITIIAANNPPIAQADKYRLPAETLLTVPARGGVLRNDSDPDGDGLGVSLATDAAHGSLTLEPSGAFTYKPDQGFTGTDTFEYLLWDGQASVSGIVTLIVTPANQPPVANADAYSVVQDTKLIVPAPSFLANDSDPEGHELFITNIQAPAHGQYTFDASGAFIYTPDPGFTGTDQMGYVTSDGELDSQAAVVLIQVTPAPVNEPPVANNDAWSMPQDSFLDVATPGFLANDSDPEGHTLTATLLTTPTPAEGTFTAVPGGGFSYRPPSGFTGQVSFTYRVSDGHSDSATATGIITVSAVNHAPVAHDDAYAMNAGLTLQVNAPGLTTNDSDPDGDALTVILSGAPAHGLLSSDGKGGFQYSPEFGFTGVDSFTYHLSDGKLDSNEATVQVTVSGFNRAPVAIDDAWSTPQDTTLKVSAPGVLANDGDPEGHALTVTVTGQPTHGQLSPHPDGSFSYTPDPGFFGIDTFTYRVNDGLIDSNNATVQISVNVVNLPPVANNDAYAMPQNTVLTVAAPGILSNDSDPEGHTLTVTITGQPGNGHLSLTAGGGFSYTPDADYFGGDSFTYKVSDGALDSNTATVALTVNEVNLPPVANNDAYAMLQDTVLNVTTPGILGNDSDPEGHALSASFVTQPAHGHLSLHPDGSFGYTPDAGYSGTDTFTYLANDGHLDSNIATVSIDVHTSNRAPVAHDDAYSIGQGSLLKIDVKKGLLSNDTDADGNQLTVQVKSQPANGILHQQSDGSFTYQPATGFNGTDSYTYLAYDGHEKSNLAKVTINVNAVNRAPLAADDSYAIASDTLLKVDTLHGLLINDADPEGDTLSAIIVVYPSKGDLHAQADGSFTYRPNTGNNGRDTFTYKAKDGQLESNVATVTIEVHSINQAPVANDDSYSVDQNTSLVVNPKGLLANDTDADGNTLQVFAGTKPTNGMLHLSLDGGFSYIPNSDYAGQDSFTYKASDGVDESDVATVTVEVNTSYQLRVNLTGQGRVTGGLTTRTVSSSIDCPVNCEATLPAGSTAGLFADLGNDVTQGSWSWAGVCPDDQAHCDYTMDADKVANVVFSCELIDIPKASIDSLEADWVCYDLRSSLDGYEILAPEGEVTFRAQNSIMLRPGFKVGEGGIFHALMSR